MSLDGDLINHKDMETKTSDWRQEFGPEARHRRVSDICADYPDNEWCRMHGYRSRPIGQRLRSSQSEDDAEPESDTTHPHAWSPKEDEEEEKHGDRAGAAKGALAGAVGALLFCAVLSHFG